MDNNNPYLRPLEFVNAPALLYCRQDGSGGVEYADPMTCKQLIADMRKAAI